MMEPVWRGMCRMESLHDGALHLEDFALMNDTIAVHLDNQMIAQEIRNRGE